MVSLKKQIRWVRRVNGCHNCAHCEHINTRDPSYYYCHKFSFKTNSYAKCSSYKKETMVENVALHVCQEILDALNEAGNDLEKQKEIMKALGVD